MKTDDTTENRDIYSVRLTVATMITATTRKRPNGWYLGVLRVTPAEGEPYDVMVSRTEPALNRQEAQWQADVLRRKYVREGGLPQRQEDV